MRTRETRSTARIASWIRPSSWLGYMLPRAQSGKMMIASRRRWAGFWMVSATCTLSQWIATHLAWVAILKTATVSLCLGELVSRVSTDVRVGPRSPLDRRHRIVSWSPMVPLHARLCRVPVRSFCSTRFAHCSSSRHHTRHALFLLAIPATGRRGLLYPWQEARQQHDH